MSLNIKATMDDINATYAKSREVGFNLMVYGQSGTGKTYAIQTLPKPVYIHSFDRHGWSTISHLIDQKNIIVDTRFEGMFGSRTALNSGDTVYELWEKEFKKLAEADFFSKIGTFVIDSATSWALSIMDAVLKQSGKRLTTGWMIGRKETPDQKDWQVQMECVKLALDSFLSLPCHCYLICHEIREKNELDGSIMTMPLLTGKLREQIPPTFDEVYKVCVTSGSSNNSYKLLTQNDGNIIAKSRMSGGSKKLAKYEDFNIKNLMIKVGKNAQDKPPLDLGGVS